MRGRADDSVDRKDDVEDNGYPFEIDIEQREGGHGNDTRAESGKTPHPCGKRYHNEIGQYILEIAHSIQL